MPRPRFLNMVFPLTLAVAVACTPAAPATPTAAPAGGQSSQPSATQAPAAQGPGLAALAALAKSASYKVTYKLSGNTGGQAVSGEQTIYAKAPKMRMDMNLGGNVASMFTLPEGMFMCSPQGGQLMCLKLLNVQTPQGQDKSAQTQTEVQNNPDKYETSALPPRTIAGQQTSCYALKPKAGVTAEFTEATMCYSAQGVPMLTQLKGTNLDYSTEATAYSSTVADADFTLPAPPMDLPAGIPGGVPRP